MTATMEGTGLATPLGLGTGASVQAWADGRTGLVSNDRWPTEGFPRADAGLVPGFRPERMLPDRKAVKLMSREVQLGVWAAMEACSGTSLPERLGIEAERLGVFASAGYEVSSLRDHEEMLAASRDPADPLRLSLPRLFAQGREQLNPIVPLRVLPDMGIFHAGLAVGARGPFLSVGSSPASGLAALGEAAEALAGGEADAALVLGTDAQAEEFRAQLLVHVGVVPSLAPGEGAAALLLRPDGTGPRLLAWGMACEPTASGRGDTGDGGWTRRDLYRRVVREAGTEPDLAIADLWGVAARDEVELFALPPCPAMATRPRLGWLGAAHGLADAVLAALLVLRGDARAVLVTASGLAGDLAAVVIGRPNR